MGRYIAAAKRPKHGTQAFFANDALWRVLRIFCILSYVFRIQKCIFCTEEVRMYVVNTIIYFIRLYLVCLVLDVWLVRARERVSRECVLIYITRTSTDTCAQIDSGGRSDQNGLLSRRVRLCVCGTGSFLASYPSEKSIYTWYKVSHLPRNPLKPIVPSCQLFFPLVSKYTNFYCRFNWLFIRLRFIALPRTHCLLIVVSFERNRWNTVKFFLLSFEIEICCLVKETKFVVS